MANLLEILNDPNYVNANLETKNAIFQKYAPSDENYSKANSSTQSAIKEKFGIGGLDEQGNAPNVFGEVAANAVPSVISGLGGLAQFPGKLADLVTGTAPDAEPGLIRKGIGAFLPFASTGAREAGGKLEEFGKELKTPTLRRKEKERATAVEAAEGELNKFKVAGLETITDPSLLSSFLFEQAPNALGSAGVGLLTKAGLKLAFKNSSQATLNAAGTGASIATQVAQQGTDVGYDTYKYIYDELVKGGMSKEQANSIAIEKGRVAALEGGAISYALSRIPGAREFEKMLFRDAAKAGVSPATFLQGLRRGAVGGGASEMGEEGGGKFASNVGIQEVFPEYKLSTGLGETTAMAGIGGSTTSGVFGGLNARAEAKAIKQNEDAIAKANAPFQYVEPQTGTTMTASVTELDDPNLVFVGTQEVGGRQVYVYAPAEGVGTEEAPATSQAAPEGDVAQSREQMLAEFEGRQLPLAEQPVDQAPSAVVQPDTEGLNDADLELLAQVTETQPAQFTDPDTGATITISRAQINDPALIAGETIVYGGKAYYTYAKIPQKEAVGQLDLTPVNPEGTVLPTPAPPAAPPVAQLPLAPVNPEGTVIAPAKPVDPNVEAQLAAVEPDVEGMIPNYPPPAPKVKATRTPKAPEAPRINYGVDVDGNIGVPFEDGGLPFPNRAAAKKANKSGMKVVAVKGGFALADKTEKDIANDRVRAKNLKSGPKGFLSAHAYIASLGGLNKNEAAELDPDAAKRNIRVGGKYVYASKGGLSMGEVATALKQEGYIENEDNNEALRVLSESINSPVYSMRDADAIAEQQFEARIQQEADEFAQKEAGAAKEAQLVSQENSEYANYLAIEMEFGDSAQSMLDAGFSQQDLNVVGFTKASPELKAEVAALMAQMEAMGLETADILAEISFTPNITDLEYYTRAKSELTKAITAAAKQGSSGNVSQANVSAASEGNQAKNKIKTRTIPTDNFTRDLSAETDTLYREMSGEGFLDLLGGNQPFGVPIFMFAESKDMALGQGKNRGITIQIGTQGLRGRPVFNKPALKQAYLDNMGEFEVKAQPSELLKNITSIDVAANAFDGLTKGQQSNLNNILDRLEANGVKVNKAAGEFELGKSAEDDLSGQKDISGGARQLPELDTTGLKIPKGRNPQVVAAGKLFQAGKMSREEFNEYVAQYTPTQEVPVDKIEPPTPLDKILGFFKSPKEVDRVQKSIPDGTRVGLRMDVPALNAGLPVVSIHEGKANTNPKTGKPYASAGSVIKYASTGHVKNVTFAPRSQEKSLDMGLNPTKEPLQTVEGEWVNSTPEETFKRVKDLSNDKSWTQVGFDPARHGYFYERSTGNPVASASEVYQVGRFLLAKDVKYAPKSDFLYSKTAAQPSAGDRAKVLSVAESVSADWTNVPDVVVVDNMQSDGIPQEVKDYDKAQTGGTTKNPEGFFYKGKIYLLASQLKDEADIIRVMNHEGLGHYGLRGLFGEALTPILDQLANARRDLVQERADAYGLDMNDLNDRRQAAEEALAILAQTRPELGFVKRAVAAIRTWLREHGFKNLKLTDDQIINDYIIPARNFIERGTQSPSEQLNDIRYSRIDDQTNTSAFKKWFGDSKVVDENGNPLVMYHGTTADFTEFDTSKRAIAGEGSFFSSTPSNSFAQGEGGRMIPAYLSFKNPKVIDLAKESDDILKKKFISQGYDSVILMRDGEIKTAVAFYPNQIKSAIGNTGEFDAQNADIRYSKSAASLQKPKPAAVWTAPDMNRKDTFIGLIQDRNISLKRVQQVIEKLPTVTQLQDNLNAYRLEDLAHGRVQVQTDDFLKFEFAPIIKEMNDNKVTEEQLTEYLLNRHAKEANELIASRNPGNPLMQDKGSSVTTKDAQDYLNNLPLAQKRVFESIAKKVDKIIEGTQDILLNNGIISKAELLGPDKNTAAENKRLKLGWRNMFEHYVPLRREETDYVLPSSSFKEIGSYSKSRTGSQKKVTDILSNVGIAREIAIVRSEKEKAKRAVYGLAVANPNPEFWMAVSPAAVLNQNLLIQELSQMGWDPADAKNIMAEPTKAYFNKDTGLVEHKINTQNRYADFVLPVKINGQDRFVFFNPNDKRAASVITALKKADTQKLNAINSYVGNITRYFAAVNTQYNLVFGAWNFVRDVQGAMLNLTTTPLNGKQGAVAKGTFTALKDIYAGIKEKNQGTLQKNPADGSWQDFLEAGGKIGYRDQFAKINDTSTLVARELKSLNRGNAYKAARSMLNWVSSVNDTLENAVRLSAYRVALQQNMSKDQAAEIAKNLTVNFNRKGSATAGLSAYYAFLNASIQGTARLAQTIDPRTKSGRLIIAGGMAIGMAQSLALMAAGFDDDEPSEFLKERNLIIPTGWLTGKRTYAMWPMPLGFNILPNTGRLLIDGAARLADGKGVGDLAINALSMAVSSTNPLGGNAATLQSYMPTIADPFVAVYENKDSFGRPIAKEDRGLNPTPGYTRSREPANPIFQGIAEFMNNITSRDPDVKGLISPTADQLSYIAEQIGGGVYREASRAVKYAVNVLNGEETPEHQVPIAGKIIGDLDSNAAISQKFYTNVKNMAEHELVIKAHRERRQSTAEYMRDNPEARLWQRANSLENEITKLNKTKKDLYQREAPKERIKRVEDQKIRMMQQFNDQVRRLN